MKFLSKITLLLCTLFVYSGLFAQTPYWEYNFTNGSYNDSQGNGNLQSSGVSKTSDRNGETNNNTSVKF